MRLRNTIPFLFALHLFAGAVGWVHAQTPAPGQTDPLLQLMMAQPAVDVTSPVIATAAFDPPVVRPGGKCVYRVTLNALVDAITEWPDEMLAPPQLVMRAGARGQILQAVGTNLQPHAAINYSVSVSTPGTFTVPQFLVDVYGRAVTVPSARLEVVADPATPVAHPLQLVLQVPDTNVFLGQSVSVRVLFPSSASNVQQALSPVQLTGEGFLVDQSAVRQTISMMPRDGRNVATFVYETMITPIVGRTLTLSAQAFTTGNRFSGIVVISGQVVIPGGPPRYLLLESDPVTLNARPLPRDGELPGFMGAIGSFTCDPPQLATNTMRVGDPVKLMVTVRGDGNLARLVAPPPPHVRDWQVFAAETVVTNVPVLHGAPGQASPGPGMLFTYTLIPLSEEARATPAIPFSCFDPERGGYVDLTIPSMPVTVTPGTAPGRIPVLAEQGGSEEKKLALSSLATMPGRTASRLRPLQQRAWFPLVQLAPILAFAGLWAWDRRRRYLETHPEIVVRSRARRALRRERRALRQAARMGDVQRFAMRAVSALRVACAPHYPAEPRALVCGDVLRLLGEPDRSGRTHEVVQRFFAVTDEVCFASGSATDTSGLLAMHAELERVLEQLEGRL